MRFFVRWIIPGILLGIWGLVLLVGVVVSTALQNPARMAEISQEIAARFTEESQGLLHGVSVHVNALGLSAWPFPALRAEDLLIRTADGLSLYVESCELRPNWKKILTGDLAISSVSLSAPSLLLDQNDGHEDKRMSFEELALALHQMEGIEIQIDDGSVLVRRGGRSGWTLCGLSGSVWLETTESGAQGNLEIDLQRLRWKAPKKPQDRSAEATVPESNADVAAVLAPLNSKNPQSAESGKNSVVSGNIPAGIDRIPSESLLLSSTFEVVTPLSPASDLASSQNPVKNNPARIEGQIRVRGDLLLNQHETPLEATLPFRVTTLEGIDLTSVLLTLDKDSGSLNGHLDWSGVEPKFQGVLELGHLSLPRWFEFARKLPPGIQIVLNNLSGRLEGEISPSSVRVLQLEGSAAGMIFTGSGGVERLDKPVVALDIRTSKVNLDSLFPELSGKKVKAPEFAAPPALKLEHTPPEPDDVGYDIRLSAETGTIRNFDVQKPSCRITPASATNSASDSRADTGYPSLEMSARGYGGTANASLIVAAKDLALAVKCNDVALDGVLSRLGISNWGGKLAASARARGQGATVTAFLSGLRGSLDARIENGSLSLDPKAKIPFNRAQISFQGEASRLKGPLSVHKESSGKTSTSVSNTIREVPVAGKWGVSLEASGWRGSMNGDGTILFSTSDWLPVRTEAFPARLSGRLDAIDVSASGRANLSFNLKESSFSLSEIAGRVDTSSTGLVSGTGPTPGNMLSGSLKGTQLATSPVWDGKLTLETSGLRAFLSRQGLLPDALPAEVFQNLRLSGQFFASEKVMRCTDLDGKLDSTIFSGTVERTMGARPHWKVDLGLDMLDLGMYFPDSNSRSDKSSTSPWPVEKLKTFDLDGSLRVQRCLIARIEHENLSLPLKLQDGVFTADPITARVYGGTAGAGFRIEATSVGALARLRYTQSNVDMLPLSKARGFSLYLTGRGTVDFDVNGRVRSSRDIPVALNGSWAFRVVNGDFRTPQGKSSFPFHSLSATGPMRSGVLTTSDILLAGTGQSIRGQGTINLVNRTLDSSFVVTGPRIPDIPVRYSGSFDNPKRTINAAGVLVNTLGDIGSGVFNILDGALNVPLRLVNP